MQNRSLPATTTDASARYLCIVLGAEHYALPLLSVHEIQAYAPPTPLPRTPPHVCGVVNLHGEVVPVIDLRLRVGMPAQSCGPLTVTVFVGLGAQVVGLIVDAASRVLDIEPAQINPPPRLADGLDLSFIAGIATQAGRVVIVLDIEKLLRGDPALAISLTGRDAATTQTAKRGS